ncbi:unnamed protein product [Phyllotreta striolata]|uniref:Peptidase S1 domain-containing protein n=1 Tax=Phyllotreta striolata TaxID=444603 RepID=A0A9N9THC3_PHYSR|nr:unnamed protein product [Phyllotreta striolata]
MCNYKWFYGCSSEEFLKMELNLIIVYAITHFAILTPFSASLPMFSGKVKLKEVPYIAAIHENDTFLCSATIVDAEWILAPSGCVRDNKPYLVSTGLNSFKKFATFEQTVAVKNVFFMDSEKEGETIAVVQVDEAFSFNENVSAIPIVNDEDIEVLLENNVELFIGGWGPPNGNKVRNLERAQVKMVDQKLCSSKMIYRFTEALNICFYIKMRDLLYTYYGGPLVVGNHLIAINLRTKNYVGLYSIYTKVHGVFKSFIDTHVLHLTTESSESSIAPSDYSSTITDEADIVTSTLADTRTSTLFTTTTAGTTEAATTIADTSTNALVSENPVDTSSQLLDEASSAASTTPKGVITTANIDSLISGNNAWLEILEWVKLVFSALIKEE